MNNELPYQTYQRITGKTWTGGNSADVQGLYKQYGITDAPGSAAANLALQKGLMGGYTAPTTQNTTPTQTDTNPVSSATTVRDENNGITADVNNMYDSTGLRNSYNTMNNDLQTRMDSLDREKQAQIDAINKSFDEAQAQQAERQGRDYAGTSTNLVTAGGGFLGYTGSQSGVLNTMQHTFDQEKAALLAKREAAIQEAKSAVDEKQFKLAAEKAQNVKDLENELYTRQKDFATQKLQLAQEARSQQEFDMGVTDKKISAYTAMDDNAFASLSPSQLAETDKYYYPGYTADARKIEKQVAAGKTLESDIKLKDSIQTLINKTPYGQKINIGGQTYVGMKSSGGSGSAKGLMPPLVIQQFPEMKGLANQQEKDVILSLESGRPAPWYKTYYESKTGQSPTEAILKSAWDNFRNDPDLQPFRNTVRLNMTESLPSGGDNSDEEMAKLLGA